MKKLILLIVFFTEFLVLPAHASEFSFAPSPWNESFGVDVFLDTKDKSVNAISGAVGFSNDYLRLEEVRDGGSLVNLWVTALAIPKSGGSIPFEGIIPGGFTGNHGKIFSLRFEVLREGSTPLTISEPRVLINDGSGTPDQVAVLPFSLVISQSQVTSGTRKNSYSNDHIPPQSFTPEIVKDENFFEGRSFLVFSTTDKESGIDHYEVLEAGGKNVPSFGGPIWVTAESPYVLRDQTLKSNVYIRAVDRAGNFIVVPVRVSQTTSSSAPTTPSFFVELFLVMILLGVGLLLRRIKQ